MAEHLFAPHAHEVFVQLRPSGPLGTTTGFTSADRDGRTTPSGLLCAAIG